MATKITPSAAKTLSNVKYEPGKGPLDDVPLRATYEQMVKDDWVGNADRCDDHDFTDYDLYGMAKHWWHPVFPLRKFETKDAALNREVGKVISWFNDTQARSMYVGPDRDGPAVGDEPSKDPQTGLPIKTADGGLVYNIGKPDAYVVGGKEFPRYQPKGAKVWAQEVQNEMLALWLFRDFLKKYQADPKFYVQMPANSPIQKVTYLDQAMSLMHTFIMNKSFLRSQWMMKIPGFLEYGNSADNNGRHLYELFQYRYIGGLGFFVPIPAKAKDFISRTKQSNHTKFEHMPWFRGAPGMYAVPSKNEACENETTALAVGIGIVSVVSTIFSFMSIGLSTIITAAISAAVDAVVFAIKVSYGYKGDFKTTALDSFDLFKAGSKGFEEYVSKIDSCIIKQEYDNVQQFFIRENFVQLWIDACDEALPKLFDPSKPGDKPTVVTPVTTVVKNPTKKIGSLVATAVAGGGVGAVVGGPVGAIIGAGVGTVLASLKRK